jgi:hypothetical protein
MGIVGGGAERGNLAGELEAGDVGRAARWRRIAPAALEHVGPVDPGPTDPDEHHARPGLRIGVLLDENLAVADRGSTHGRGV